MNCHTIMIRELLTYSTRCEQTLSNSPLEVHALVEEARLFLEAEWTNQTLKCPGFEEHLIAAMNCYNFAIKGLNKPDQAMSYDQRAADLHVPGALCDILARCEVTKVLLLMLLQPTLRESVLSMLRPWRDMPGNHTRKTPHQLLPPTVLL
ncbi:uncharacterized protein LOC144922760 isoform X3 [Branchiostoma floridae x Branchiostoma belcheri]